MAAAANPLAFQHGRIAFVQKKIQDTRVLLRGREVTKQMPETDATMRRIHSCMDTLKKQLPTLNCPLPNTWESLRIMAKNGYVYSDVDKSDLIKALDEIDVAIGQCKDQAVEQRDARRASMGLPPKKKSEECVIL